MSISDYLKSFFRRILISLNLNITENIKTDILTKKALRRILSHTSNCIDIGAHKGELLDMFLRLSPQGRHIAFEPIPHLYQQLKKRYSNQAKVYPYALSDQSGTTTFQHVTNAEAYSGIKRRSYDVKEPNINVITVESKTLDEMIDDTVDLIKIDVEGGEYQVLIGAQQIINQCKPSIIFEFGKGASEYYETTPEMMFQLLANEYQYDIFNLANFISKKEPYKLSSFRSCFEQNSHYYFVAQPKGN